MLISCGRISSSSVRNSSHNLQEKISKSTYGELKVKQSNDFTNRSCKKFNYIYNYNDYGIGFFIKDTKLD